MNNERTVIIRNIGDCPVGLKDTQGRMYRLAKNAQMRISEASLQDILDYPPSRVLFDEDKAKVSNITRDKLFSMGLTEEEIEQFLDKESVPAIVITEDLEAEEDEEVIIVEEPVQEEIKEERLVVKKAQPTNTPKKPTNKKSTKKTASRK